MCTDNRYCFMTDLLGTGAGSAPAQHCHHERPGAGSTPRSVNSGNSRAGAIGRSLTRDQRVTYYDRVDAVFKALADPTRRSLLDELFVKDGQTLSSLEERFAMTRFGVMKHLKQLEEARLVVSKRRGREKLHFLNPVPIRLVHDRWVSKYAEPWAAALSGLKHSLESPMEKVFEIYIRTTPERLWEAITDSETRSKYNFGARVTSDWTPGSRYEMSARDGTVALGEGENLEVDPPRRLGHRMGALLGDRGAGGGNSG